MNGVSEIPIVLCNLISDDAKFEWIQTKRKKIIIVLHLRLIICLDLTQLFLTSNDVANKY